MEARAQERPTPVKIPDASAQELQSPGKISDAAGVLIEETVTGLVAGQVTANAAAGAHTTGEKVMQRSTDGNLGDAEEMSLVSADDQAAMAAAIQEIEKPSGQTKRKLSASTGAEVVDEDSSGGKEDGVKENPKRRRRKGGDGDNADPNSKPYLSKLSCSCC